LAAYVTALECPITREDSVAAQQMRPRPVRTHLR